MPIDKQQSTQMVNEAQLPVLRTTARQELAAIFGLLNSELQSPLRLFASDPSDALLNIASNAVIGADGARKTILSADDAIGLFAATTINLQTAAIVGGTVQVQGAAFALPTTTIGQFRRLALVYSNSTNIVNTIFSAAAASVAALSDPVNLFTALDGTPIGYIDLEATAANAFKTAGSATSVVENSVGGTARIVKPAASGSGSGGGGGTDLKLQAIAANVGTLKKGFLRYDSTLIGLEADISFNLKTAVSSLGVVAPSASTSYYLYLDMGALPVSLTTHASVGFQYYAVSSGTTGMLVVLTADASTVDLSRYIPIALLRTDGSSNYALKADAARKIHSGPSVNVSPLVYEDSDHSIGTVGSAGQLATYGSLATTDFPNTTTLHVYGGNEASGTSLNDSASSPIALTGTATPLFNRVGFFGRETIPSTLNGSSQFWSSTNAEFSYATASGATSFGGWFYKENWADATARTLMSIGTAAATCIRLSLTTGNTVRVESFATSITPSASTSGMVGWNHISVTLSTTTARLYINGQLIGSATITSGTTGNGLFVGALNGASEFSNISIQDVFIHKGTVLTDSQVNVIASKRYKGKQIAGGHVLATDSFPLNSLASKVSYWNLATLNDSSGNGKTLTNVGSTPFTGLDIFGVSGVATLDGSSQRFTSADALFNPGNTPFSYGGWFSTDNWARSIQQLMGNNGASHTWRIHTDTTGIVFTCGTSAPTVVPSITPQAGSWNHLASVYDGTGAWYLYVNGVQVGTSSNTNTAAAGTFTLGANTAGSQSFFGRMQDVFFASVALSGLDILKLASARIDLPSNVAVRLQDQDWNGNFISEDGQTVNELSDAFLVDKDNTKIWAYFGGGSASRVNLRLYDGGLGATTVPVRKFDRSYTAALPTTIAHGLPSRPTSIEIQHNENADGRYVNLNAETYLKCDDTNIYTTTSSLTIDATRDVRIVASIGVPAIGAGGGATSTVAGTVTSFSPIVLSAVNTVSAAGYTILTADGYQTIAVSLMSGADRTITLPATASNVGRKISVVRTATDGEGSYRVIINAAGADVIYGGHSITATTLNLDRRFQCTTLECLASGIWSQVEATGTIILAANLDGNFTAGAIYAYRIGNSITIQISSPAWTAGSTSRSTSAIVLPAGFRPGVRTVFACAARNGSHGYDVTFVAETTGIITVQTSDGAASSMDDYAGISGSILIRF